MQGLAQRRVGFPGDRIGFEVRSQDGSSLGQVSWSGGGDPPTGTGLRFVTRFETGGTYTVTAEAGAGTVDFGVEICPIDRWLEDARAFYGPSIDFSRVRVKESWLVLGPPGIAWTCNDVIRFKRARRPEDLPHQPTLIHELGHVWEHQAGQAQLLAGAVEQLGRRLRKTDPYDYGGPAGVRRASRLQSFGKEGQAQIIMEWWKARQGTYPADSRGVPFATPGYIDDLRRLVEGAGIGQKRSRRRTLAGIVDAVVARITNAVLAPID